MEEQNNLYDWIYEDNTTTKVNQKSLLLYIVRS